MDIEELIEKLDFTAESLSQAMLEQAKLTWDVSEFRIRKMRVRLRAEAELASVQTEISLKLRRGDDKDKKRTEGHIREITSNATRVVEAREKLDEARVAEEWSKLLLDAYHQRASMAKALVQLIGAEAALESKFVKDEFERMGVKKLRDKVRSRFPGGRDREE